MYDVNTELAAIVCQIRPFSTEPCMAQMKQGIPISYGTMLIHLDLQASMFWLLYFISVDDQMYVKVQVILFLLCEYAYF